MQRHEFPLFFFVEFRRQYFMDGTWTELGEHFFFFRVKLFSVFVIFVEAFLFFPFFFCQMQMRLHFNDKVVFSFFSRFRISLFLFFVAHFFLLRRISTESTERHKQKLFCFWYLLLFVITSTKLWITKKKKISAKNAEKEKNGALVFIAFFCVPWSFSSVFLSHMTFRFSAFSCSSGFAPLFEWRKHANWILI